MIDADDMRRGLLALKLAFDDADTVAIDMLRPPRKRELGPVLAKRNYDEARGSFASRFADLMAMAGEEPEPGDPSGNGGAGPPH